MSKKHKKFFLVVEGSMNYIKLESDLIFSKEEGVEALRKTHPDATEIKPITIKTANFLDLK